MSHALEEGEKCLLEEYNEAYDDWYNSSVDEILYEDPDEIGEDLAEIGGKQMFMSRYAAEYSRRSAFRTELQNYGWVKSRK